MTNAPRITSPPPWYFWVLAGLLCSLVGCLGHQGKKGPKAVPLTDITWQWIESVTRDDAFTTTVPDPEKFTLVFRTDGTYSGRADCNLIAGRYAEKEGFKLIPGPSTMAFCGEASLDRKYLELLGRISTGGLDDKGRLILATTDGSVRMLFRNGGTAP